MTHVTCVRETDFHVHTARGEKHESLREFLKSVRIITSNFKKYSLYTGDVS